MAIILSSKYPGQVAVDATNYPWGKARNVTVDGDGTGTPFEADLLNDILGFLQATLHNVGYTPSGNPDTAVSSQYLQALVALFAPHNNYIVDMGKLSGALTTATQSTTYVNITGADLALTGTITGDILVGEYYLGISMTSGNAYVNLQINDDGAPAVESLAYKFVAPSPIGRVYPFHHVITTNGTTGIVPQLKIDAGGDVATIVPYNGTGSSMFCRYQLIRP